MCVIINCRTAKPVLEVLQQCATNNRDGGGIAWVQEGKVHYRKGLNPAQVFELVSPDTIRLPVVIHFRSASSGMEKSPALCHPFPVNRYATAAEQGTADKVLFHNGLWSDWRSWCLNYALQSRGRVPFGAWSDSRGLAWAIYHKGEGMLNLVPGKYSILSARNGLRQYGDGWTEDNGISFSNTTWRPYVSSQTTNNNGQGHQYGLCAMECGS